MNTECIVDHVKVLKTARFPDQPNRRSERSADDFLNFFDQMYTEKHVDRSTGSRVIRAVFWVSEAGRQTSMSQNWLILDYDDHQPWSSTRVHSTSLVHYYFKDLSIQTITQEHSYDIWNLACKKLVFCRICVFRLRVLYLPEETWICFLEPAFWQYVWICGHHSSSGSQTLQNEVKCG